MLLITPRYTHPDHDLLLTKAGTFVEALPWIGQFAGEIVVIKYGGNAMIDDDLKCAFAEDIVFLRRVGLRSMVIHGGGPQINSVLERPGIISEFRGGLGVTTSKAMDVVHMVLVGQVSRELVGLISAHPPFAVDISGEDGGLLRARRRGLVEGGREIDLRFVGGVNSVDPSTLFNLIKTGRIPVVATVAPGPDDQIYNVNASTTTPAPTLALGAKRLVMLIDVAGLYANYPDESVIISSTTPGEVRQLMPGLTSGIVPKMEACARAVEGGVHSATIIDDRVPHCLLLGVFTDGGMGTMICEEPVRVVRPNSGAAIGRS